MEDKALLQINKLLIQLIIDKIKTIQWNEDYTTVFFSLKTYVSYTLKICVFYVYKQVKHELTIWISTTQNNIQMANNSYWPFIREL